MNKPFAIPTFFSQALVLAIFGGTAGCSPSSTETASPLSLAAAKSAHARQAFRRALMRYDDIRARLAQDQTQGIPESAQAFRSDIEQVLATEHPYPAALLQEAGARAAKLVEQKDIAKSLVWCAERCRGRDRKDRRRRPSRMAPLQLPHGRRVSRVDATRAEAPKSAYGSGDARMWRREVLA